MELVEIDPKLFLTCRLCVKEQGSYQIMPLVREQIKYCFDIEVEQFDGLSQIICKTCKSLLEQFSIIKQGFKNNQDALAQKKKSQNYEKEHIKQTELWNIIPNENTVLKTLLDKTHEEKLNNNHLSEEHNKKNKCTNFVSNAESKSISKSENTKNIQCNKETTKPNKNDTPSKFHQYYACQYCSIGCELRIDILKHVKTHENMIKIKSNTIKKHCKVTLNRIDKVTNVNGSVNESKIVKLSPNTFVLDKGHLDYFVTFSPVVVNTPQEINDVEFSIKTKSRKRSHSSTNLTISDDDSEKPKKLRKRIRVMSGSSEDDCTLMDISNNENIESDARAPTTAKLRYSKLSKNVSVNKDDVRNELVTNKFDLTATVRDIPSQRPIIDEETIATIVLGLYNKSFKKLEAESKPQIDVASLNRKISSIGIKIMSKKGLSSPGLLKYLEHRPLSIEWVQNSDINSKEGEYVRIVTKTAVPYLHQMSGFKCMPDRSKILKSMKKTINCKETTELPTENLSQLFNVPELSYPQILNANPVDNPKQLPKKKSTSKDLISPGLQQATQISQQEPNITICLDSDEEQSGENGCYMPIITHTTSLASPVKATQNTDWVEVKIESQEVEPNMPDIAESKCAQNTERKCAQNSESKCTQNTESKCAQNSESKCTQNTESKCAQNTESKSALNKESKSAQNTESKSGLNNALGRIFCKPISELTQTTVKNERPKGTTAPSRGVYNGPSVGVENGTDNNTTHSNNKPIFVVRTLPEGHVLLHSNILPNTMTNSPFTYVKDLLLVYGLNFVDSAAVTTNFYTLIKFRLAAVVENEKVLFTVALYAYEKNFCITINCLHKDKKYVPLVSEANFQWYIIKAFQNTIVAQKLQNTDTKFNKEHLNIFMHLLQSIELKA